MFCVNCGKEIYAGSRFCSHCGTEQAPQPVPGSPPSRNAVGLTDYHLRDWWAECPSCHFKQTVDNTRCGNDGSPVVVAFGRCKKPSAMFLPVHLAALRCLNDCGMGTDGLTCVNCGTLIMGRHIQFKFPQSLMRRHRLFHGISFACFFAALAVFASTAFATYKVLALIGPDTPPEVLHSHGANVLFWTWLCLIAASFLSLGVFVFTIGFSKEYQSQDTFTFDSVAKASKQYAKQKAISDALEHARATRGM